MLFRSALYQVKGEYDAAINAMKTALENNPNYAFVWARVGELYLMKGDNDSAISTLKAAVEIDPNYVSAWLTLGESYRMKGEYDELVDMFWKSMESGEKVAIQLVLLARVLIDDREFADAIKVAEEDIEGDEKFPDIWNVLANLGEAYIAKAGESEVIHPLNSSMIQKYRIAHELCRLRARLYMAKGDHTQVVKAYERLIDMNPSNVGISIDSIQHYNICDACTPDARIRGYQFRCVSCLDYDLCEICINTVPHPHPNHKFLRIPSEEWVQRRQKKLSQST